LIAAVTLMMTSVRVDEALSRLRGLFLEVPSTTMSIEHACRLTGLDDATCLALLLALEQGQFLRRSRAGYFQLNAAPSREEL
jgi:DNA-binding IclR family transcriptional regulator